jgi:hypothetical protein
MSRTQSWHGARLPYERQDLGALAFTGALVGEARRKVPMTRAQPKQQPRLAGTAHARHLARQRAAACSSKTRARSHDRYCDFFVEIRDRNRSGSLVNC